MTSVLFLVQFENFDQTMDFYWSYMLTLPVLMHSCISGISYFPPSFPPLTTLSSQMRI